jgi:hypothetical protein
MRATLIVAFCLAAVAGMAVAQTAPPSSSPAKKGKAKTEAAEKAPTEADGKGTFNWYADCLKLWEPATHMSRKEWDRACRRQAQLQKEIDDMGLPRKK